MKKRAFKELKRAHFFNVSHKRANISLDPPSLPPIPPPKGLYFSVLGEKNFSPFLKKGNASDYQRQCGLNYPLV